MTIFNLSFCLTNMGISVMPVKEKSKVPLIDWKQYQTELPNKTDLITWFENKNNNLGIVTGRISQLIVVDIDSNDAIEWAKTNLPPTPMSTKTKKGVHLFYRYPTNGHKIKNKVKFKMDGKLLDLDIRGDGGYVVGPLSTHESGFIYKMTGNWLSLNFDSLPVFDPNWFFSPDKNDIKEGKIDNLNPNIIKKINSLGQAIEGNGGDDLTYKAACVLIRDCGLKEEEALRYLQSWNLKNIPSWSDDELKKKISNALNHGNGAISRNLRLQFTSAKNLLLEPKSEVSWIWGDILPSVGTSMIASKPKIGKTTFTRCLATAIAKGQDFLGRKTNKGTVFYIAAEENREMFKLMLEKLDCAETDNLFVHTGPTPSNVLEELHGYMEQYKPALVIIDTLFKVFPAKDSNDYAQTTVAFLPILNIVAKYNCHILVVHHQGKVEREHGDQVLGSTAFTANVDTIMLLDRREGKNTFKTIQRYGESIEAHYLFFDEETKMVTIGEKKSVVHNTVYQDRILSFMKKARESYEDAIVEEVEGSKKSVGANLRMLVKKGSLVRTGKGNKGSPYLYIYNENQEPENPGF